MSSHIHTWPPHITVATIVQRNNHYLMVEEEDGGRLVINQPAGHLDPGESLQAAALRETLEETGWVVELTGFTGFYQYQAQETLYHRFAFLATAIELTDRPLDPDITATHWLTLDEITRRDQRSPMVGQCIRDALDAVYPLALIREIQP